MFGLSLLGFFAGAISIFLMFLILIQRGKGGGLTGALGGMGGQSAFGSKAGDLFTRITVITAIIWMTCCLLIIKVYNYPPATAEIGNTSGEVTGDDGAGGIGTGLTGEGGGEFSADGIGGTDGENDTAPGDDSTAPGEDGDDSDPTTIGEEDPVIGGDDAPTTGDADASGEGEDAPIIEPETGGDGGAASSEEDN
jgi:preprotein translocase subunit SecG